MSIVTLVSGGLDSTLMALLAKEAGVVQHPLFVDYGQRARTRELAACRAALRRLGLPRPSVVRLAGYARIAPSGLTTPDLDVFENAFTPGRNLLFLLAGAAYAYHVKAQAVAIGLLNDDTSIFPDQKEAFLDAAATVLTIALGRPIQVIAPLRAFFKRDVVTLARSKKLGPTYSCHSGAEDPCGVCVACREFRS